jgi:hypothetical protein
MPEVIPVETYHDLVSDDHLGLAAANAIARALDRTAAADVDVLYLPRPLAEEKVLDSEDDTDCVFIAEFVADRETGAAYYARQGRRGCWLPKSATCIYRSGADADILVPDTGYEQEGSV